MSRYFKSNVVFTFCPSNVCDSLSYLWAYSDPRSSFFFFFLFPSYPHLLEIHLDDSTFPSDFSLEVSQETSDSCQCLHKRPSLASL